MGTALIKIKIMPTSPDVNLEEIKKEAKKTIEENNGLRLVFSEEPIAFGLKAVIASFDIDEENPLEVIEENLRKIQNVNSAEVIDMRRAFG
ncbi:MAG: elongation factor 1-beta [Candidatus Pacearchaeota archaeon]|jgi:elongation factor 1-beta